MNQFMWGAIVMACATAGLFFLRFWRKTHDRLFAIFALAFLVFAVHYVMLVGFGSASETAVVIYGVRAFAFALILLAILDKNRAPSA